MIYRQGLIECIYCRETYRKKLTHRQKKVFDIFLEGLVIEEPPMNLFKGFKKMEALSAGTMY